MAEALLTAAPGETGA